METNFIVTIISIIHLHISLTSDFVFSFITLSIMQIYKIPMENKKSYNVRRNEPSKYASYGTYRELSGM